MRLDAKNNKPIRDFENWVKDELYGTRTTQPSTKEQPMSDTLQERKSFHIGSEHCNECFGSPHAPWCSGYEEPAKEVSGPPRITYTCPNCGKIDEHSDNCPSRPRASEQPAARGRGDEWHVGSRSNSPEGDATIYTVKGNRWIGQVKAKLADQIVTEHNQYHSLVAERERLRETLKQLGGYAAAMEMMLNTETEGEPLKEAWAVLNDEKRGAR